MSGVKHPFQLDISPSNTKVCSSKIMSMESAHWPATSQYEVSDCIFDHGQANSADGTNDISIERADTGTSSVHASDTSQRKDKSVEITR